MEVWEPIKNYEGFYEISNLGNIKSLSRIILNRGINPFLSKEKIIKQNLHKGYFYVTLCKNGKPKIFLVHQLIAIAFLNHTPNCYVLSVNHKDFNKQNNNLENLEVVTVRENSNQKHIKSKSKYTGVQISTNQKNWKAIIVLNGKNKYLGTFKTEIQASNAYQNALKNV